MKKFLLAAGIFCMFAIGYGAATFAYPAGGVAGRAEYYGYFQNDRDFEGTFVFPKFYRGDTEALPDTINSATEFINFIKYTQLDIDGNGGTSAQERTGAAFIIQSMIGTSRDRTPSDPQIAEWERRVRFAEREGLVSWRTSHAYSINSYYQGTKDGPNPQDDAFFDESGNGPAIVFRGLDGSIRYVIRWECANPVGNIRPLEDDQPLNDYSILGRTTVSDTTVEPGQTFTFSHYLRNLGPTDTGSTQIWWIGLNPANGATTGGPASSGTYTDGQEKRVQTETVTVPISAVPFSQICRQVGWDPVNESGTRNGRGPVVCATVIPVFDLRPTIEVLINGQPPVPNSIAEPADTIEFRYAVTNNGITPSTSVNCTVYRMTFVGYHTAQDPPESTAGWLASAPGAGGCPRVFPTGSTPLYTETIAPGTTDANRSHCRVLSINPTTYGGGARGVEACVQVGAKPYFRVYDGDVSAGNGFPAACASSNSSIVTWNKESPSFSGAGTQAAAYAINQIHDFATAYGNGAGAAPASGLAFANTTTSGSSIFGGAFESLPCVADYYARRDITPTIPFTNMASMNGFRSYTATGPIALSGANINVGQQSVLYVDGDVLLTGNITYNGNWTPANMPLFQLVVRGNIYIARGVGQLDGVYIAQPSNATNGTIYTCANPGLPATAVAPTAPTFYADCNGKLTVNGAFVARQVQFLRTRGTLSLSSPGEGSGSTNIAEVFNFSPAAWIQQPPVPTTMLESYDAITSLPPVL